MYKHTLQQPTSNNNNATRSPNATITQPITASNDKVGAAAQDNGDGVPVLYVAGEFMPGAGAGRSPGPSGAEPLGGSALPFFYKRLDDGAGVAG